MEIQSGVQTASVPPLQGALPTDVGVSRLKPPRDIALDALRGLALLLMVASGLMPWDPARSLPAWMYHAQEPPPTHTFNPHLAGLTWVDLVFPIFLFALGASIPLAGVRRLERDASGRSLLLHTLERGALLVWLALYRNYIDPERIQPGPGRRAWALALLSFFLLFPMYMQLPERWPVWVRRAIRVGGVGAGVVLLSALYYHTERRFSLGDSDIILMVLANMAVFGVLIWYCTRTLPLIRLAIMGALVASRLASGPPGWVHSLYNASRLPFPPYWVFDWFFQLDFQKYLLIVLPGTLVGDLLLKWREEQRAGQSETGARYIGPLLALLALCLTVALLVGLEARILLPTTLLAWAICGAALWITARPTGPTERLLNGLVRWGSYWIVLGLTLEPFQGGIKKDSATLSYLFLTPGIACYLLSAMLVINASPVGRRPLILLAEVGQNPLIGYVAMQNFILPIFGIIGLNTRLADWFMTPWQLGFLAALETLLLAYLVRLCSRFRIYWRA